MFKAWRCIFSVVLPLTIDLVGVTAASAMEYKSHEECILDKMKGVTSDVAAKAIIAACRKLTSPQELDVADCELRLLSGEDVNLGGKATHPMDTLYVDVYNPSAFTIKKVELAVKSKADEIRHYEVDVLISPKSTSIASVRTGFSGEEIKSWDITRVYGCLQHSN